MGLFVCLFVVLEEISEGGLMCDKPHSPEPHVRYSGSIVKGELDGETSVVALPGNGCLRECNDPREERGTFSYLTSSL